MLTARSFASTRTFAYPPANGWPEPAADRRSGDRWLAQLLNQMLDELDYGLVLVGDATRMTYANHAARAVLAGEHPLQLSGGEVRTRFTKDAAPFHAAMEAACQRGLRRLLALGQGVARVAVSIVPLAWPQESPVAPTALSASAATTGPARFACLLVLGKPQLCGVLAVQAFARAYALSAGEEQVLRSLSEGDSPQDIARDHGVKIATVRSQINSIRLKTGTASIRDLLRQVAVLPPVVGALRQATAAPSLADVFAQTLQAA
jgi:DNA-binding CsgD family transcriptional regulator